MAVTKWLLASSSQGTVLKEVVQKSAQNLAGILTDRECGARDFAKRSDLPHWEFENWNQITENHPVLLLGFKRILKPEELGNRQVYNIHPSFLPLHKGWNEQVHQSVLDSGQRLSAVTLHEVTPEVDSGRIIMQYPFPVMPEDTISDLTKRCQKIETYLAINFINNKLTNQWWDLCVESLAL